MLSLALIYLIVADNYSLHCCYFLSLATIMALVLLLNLFYFVFLMKANVAYLAYMDIRIQIGITE